MNKRDNCPKCAKLTEVLMGTIDSDEMDKMAAKSRKELMEFLMDDDAELTYDVRNESGAIISNYYPRRKK